MKFEVISQITNVTTIAKGKRVDIRHLLNREYGDANWRKMKGLAIVEYENS